jgi:hypothetical protein
VSFVLFAIFGDTTEWEDVGIDRESHQTCESSASTNCRHFNQGRMIDGTAAPHSAAWRSPDRYYGGGHAIGGAVAPHSVAWLSPRSDAWISEPTSRMMSTSKRRKRSGFDNLRELARIASLFQSNLRSIIVTNKLKKCLPFPYFLLHHQQCLILFTINTPLRLLRCIPH